MWQNGYLFNEKKNWSLKFVSCILGYQECWHPHVRMWSYHIPDSLFGLLWCNQRVETLAGPRKEHCLFFYQLIEK